MHVFRRFELTRQFSLTISISRVRNAVQLLQQLLLSALKSLLFYNTAVLKLLLCLAATIAASYLCEMVIGEPIRDPDFGKSCEIGGQEIYGR